MTTNREILRLAVPSILANITIPLVGIVDTAIVGHLGTASAIGGIAIGTMLFDLLYWNFGFLRIGTSGLTAQAFGRRRIASGGEQPCGESSGGEQEAVSGECRKILAQSLSVAAIAALFVWAIQWLFVTAVLAIVPCSAEVASVARQYFFVRIWAAPATLMLFTFKGWFIGMQDTKSPMAVDILVNVVNMVASYVLAVHTPLGVVGVAFGTVIAQYSGLILAVGILGFRYIDISIFRDLEVWKDAMRWSEMRRMMALNGNLVIRSLCFIVVYVGFTSLASRYGDTELAVSSIIMKLFMFFSYFVDGFAYAGEALVGKAYGERTAVNGIVKSLFNWAIGVGIVFTAIYALWGEGCIALMTNDAEVLVAAQRYRIWLIAMPLVSALAFMWDGVYIGATAGVHIRNSMIWAAVGFVAAYAALAVPFGMTALYVAYFAHLIARVVYLSANWKGVSASTDL